MRIEVEYSDLATPAIRRRIRKLGKVTALNKVAAGGALQVFGRHFSRLAATETNKLGAPSSGFWQRMANGLRADGDRIKGWVRVPPEAAHRRYGGWVKPKKAKMLAIPALAIAYNKSPRDFSFLRSALIMTKKGLRPALVDNARTVLGRGSKKSSSIAGGTVYYWLAPRVKHDPNPRIYPPDADVLRGARDAVADYLEDEKIT